MRRATLVAVIAAMLVLGALVALITLLSGSAPPPAAADFDISSREYGGALIALLVLGFIALGADWQDWL